MNIELNFYNSNIITTYKNKEIFNFEDDDDLSQIAYQNQVMQIFNMSLFDEKILSDNIEKIYYFLLNNQELSSEVSELIELIKNQYSESSIMYLINKNDNIMFFQLLFSFDYFDKFHPYLSCILNNKSRKIKFNLLKNLISEDF